MNMMWIITSAEFIAESHQNKTGQNKGKRTIWFNRCKTDRTRGAFVEHCKPQFTKYIATNFQRLIDVPDE
jgi:hypothetical protein